jgi:hypothetical protein
LISGFSTLGPLFAGLFPPPGRLVFPGVVFGAGVSTFLMRLRFLFASSFEEATGFLGLSTGSSILPKTVGPDKTCLSKRMVSIAIASVGFTSVSGRTTGALGFS